MYTLYPLLLPSDLLDELRHLAKGTDLAPGPGGGRITPVAIPACLQTIVQAASLISLAPTAQIPAHRDQPLPNRRLHIPLETNPGCWSYSDGHWQQLALDHAYAMDPAVEHGAVNWGPTRRVHLMLDLKEGV